MWENVFFVKTSQICDISVVFLYVVFFVFFSDEISLGSFGEQGSMPKIDGGLLLLRPVLPKSQTERGIARISRYSYTVITFHDNNIFQQ